MLKEAPQSINPEQLGRIDALSSVRQILPEVPTWSERNIPAERKMVGIHEFGHGVVARKYGVEVDYISTVKDPHGRYEGITVLRGSPHSHALEVIAAGGSHHSGKGNGSDRAIIRRHGTGRSEESVFASASAVCKEYSPLEWEFIGQISAYMGVVSGHQIDAVVERARWEAKLYTRMQGDTVAWVTADENKTISETDARVKKNYGYDSGSENTGTTEIITKRVDLDDGTIKLVTILGGTEKNEEIFCPHCGITDSHMPECELVKILPKSATIFDRKSSK